ncbi:hypothetical protein A1353_21610 [Methylomonas methanica]|uniref:AAA domain-containing protein n=2 Tax=Methylomonas methanica TaxID=421 RepID=A0A177M096_METMH|nr:hypothetical protein A1353_21610 [Methylomonas methanica]
MKGGVGKTTLSFNIAIDLATSHDKKVLLVDLDPQANATIVSMSETEIQNHEASAKKTITHALMRACRPIAPVRFSPTPSLNINDFLFNRYSPSSPSKTGRMDMIPSDLQVSTMLRSLPLGPFDLDALLTNSVINEYDYILLDCAPTYSTLTNMALNSSRGVLIPMIADSFGVWGTNLMQEVLQDHNAEFGHVQRKIGVVFTLWEDQTHARKYSGQIIARWANGKVFTTKIGKNNWYRIANGQRVDIGQKSPAAKAEFNKLMQEFLAYY